MAFSQGTATSQEDFISQLFTFLTANGWTQNQLDTTNDRASIQIGTVHVHFHWNNVDRIDFAHSLGFRGPIVAVSATVAAGGTGYTVGDDLTLVGGTGTAATFNVDSVSGGVVTAVSLLTEGAYTVFPGNPVSTTGGTGTGCTLTVTSQVIKIDEHTNSSGNGKEDGSSRRMNLITNGPFTAHFFHTDALTYAHAILEVSPGLYRSFSFGQLTKVGTWTGGEYATTSFLESVASFNHLDNRHNHLFEGLVSGAGGACTVHAEGLPNEGGSSRWGVMWDGAVGFRGNDGDGNARIDMHGHLRGGFLPNAVSFYAANPNNGFIPMYPIHVYYRDRTFTPERWRLIGFAPDIRGINMKNIEPAEEFVVGSDTWKIYPWVQKRDLDTGQESKNMGFAVKKIP